MLFLQYQYRPIELAICRDRFACVCALLAKGADLDIKTRSIRKSYKDLLAAEHKRRNCFEVTTPVNLKKLPSAINSKHSQLQKTLSDPTNLLKDSEMKLPKELLIKTDAKQTDQHQPVGLDEPEKNTNINTQRLPASKQQSSEAKTVPRPRAKTVSSSRAKTASLDVSRRKSLNVSRRNTTHTLKEELENAASRVLSHQNKLSPPKSPPVANSWFATNDNEEKSENEQTALRRSPVQHFLGKNSEDAQQELPPTSGARATKAWHVEPELDYDTPETADAQHSASAPALSAPALLLQDGKKSKKIIMKKKKKSFSRRRTSLRVRKSSPKGRLNVGRLNSRARLMSNESTGSESSASPKPEHAPTRRDEAIDSGEESAGKFCVRDEKLNERKVDESKVDEKVRDGEEFEDPESGEPMTLGFILAAQEMMKLRRARKPGGFRARNRRPRPASARRSRKVVNRWKKKADTISL